MPRKTVFQDDTSSVEFSYDRYSFVSNTSIYLEGPALEFLEYKLRRGVKLGGYLVWLFIQYKHVLPKHLPKNHKLKKMIQPRLGNRKRFCFRPYSKHYVEMLMMAKAADVSFGYIVAVLLKLDQDGTSKIINKDRGDVVIAADLNRIVETLTIKNDPFRCIMSRTYNYQPPKYHFYTFY